MPTGVYERKPRVSRVSIICEQCGGSRDFLPSKARKLTGRFCSHACATASKSKPESYEVKPCAQCGELFRSHKRFSQKYCSRACQGIARRVERPKWENPEYRKAYHQKYQKENMARVLSRAQQWRAENPQKRKAIAAKYAHKKRLAGFIDPRIALQSRKRAATADQIKQLFGKAKHRCVYCAKPTRISTLDHITPVSAGGMHNVKNLIPCCKQCNSSKGAKEVSDWLFEKHGEAGLARALVFLTKKKIIDELYECEAAA